MEQGTNYLPYIIVGVVMMLVGWGMGFFDSNQRTSKKIKQAETSAEAAIKEASSKVTQAEEKLAAVAANPVQEDDPGLLRIRNASGSLTLDLDGSRVDTTALNAEQRKRLIEMLTWVRPWLEGKPVSMPPAPPPAPRPQPAPVTDARPTAPPPAMAMAPNPKIIATEDRPAAPAGSIVNQIDSILQARLIGTPLESRGVFLSQSPEGGVNVYVGLTKYMGVDAVPDEEVKAAIRGAIQEWENKYTPGL